MAETDISGIVAAEGEGFTFCVFPGGTQEALVARTFPKGLVVEVASSQEMTHGVCEGVCEVVVDSLTQMDTYVGSGEACQDKVFGEPEAIPPPSSGGDTAIATHRATCGM